ncbi:hypothetical protein ACFVZD_47050 [Streptomyces sp. NPDC058287]|uniref:hypothetical protein n=1 Tax=Streptomyces sp. NPDC058287 TaxID=3346423 RepID=UPI0036E3C70B
MTALRASISKRAQHRLFRSLTNSAATGAARGAGEALGAFAVTTLIWWLRHK